MSFDPTPDTSREEREWEDAEAWARIEAHARPPEPEDYDVSEEHLLLKWGTLKGWHLTSDAAKTLLREYSEIGVSAGAMSQIDTPRQKEILCKLIDLCEGPITNDWSGQSMTKEEAKAYISAPVMTYGLQPTRSTKAEG